MSASSGGVDFLGGAGGEIGFEGGAGDAAKKATDFSFAFLSLLIAQGFFAGIVIGKLAEGKIKSGIKHSFIMVAMALLISTGAKLLLGSGAAAVWKMIIKNEKWYGRRIFEVELKIFLEGYLREDD